MKDSLIVLALCHFFSVSVSAQSAVISREQYAAHLHDMPPLTDTTDRLIEIKSAAAADSLTESEWEQWRTVENHFYGKNRGSLPMIADLRALHPYFRAKVEELIRICKAAGITLAIVESYRTPAKQAEYYGMGKKYTNTRGGKSRHQYGLAVDVVPMIDSIAVWDNPKLWKAIGVAGERLGLRWGGRWRVLYDPGHFEWIGGVSRYELANGKLPRIPPSFAQEHPNFKEELKELQESWKAWSVQQSIMTESASGQVGQ